MKLLWVNTNFMHPTTKGGQIRTLEMLRQLCRRHVQANRMFRFERQACRAAARVVAVLEQDACTMRELFGVTRVTAIPTGVDIVGFTPPAPPPDKTFDLVFVGSMDWLPNVDGIQWFVREVLPLIRRQRPECSLAIVGRRPPSSITALGIGDERVRVTGTVPDIRPLLWSAAVSIVPLRIGSGTRLKIYEAMATAGFSWEHVVGCFERVLDEAPQFTVRTRAAQT
jgi:glycosyltransferase involved in cell wall biosynthesis